MTLRRNLQIWIAATVLMLALMIVIVAGIVTGGRRVPSLSDLEYPDVATSAPSQSISASWTDWLEPVLFIGPLVILLVWFLYGWFSYGVRLWKAAHPK
jgi:hypothetical protein